jgi:hypothetical protein
MTGRRTRSRPEVGTCLIGVDCRGRAVGSSHSIAALRANGGACGQRAYCGGCSDLGAGFGAGDISASMLMIAISTHRSATFSMSASISGGQRTQRGRGRIGSTRGRCKGIRNIRKLCVDLWTFRRRGDRARPVQIALAAMFTISATKVTLKKNETMPWAVAVRRIGLDAIATSETCDVMPMMNEK